MFENLKAALRRLDFWLRDEEYYPASESRVYPLEEVEDDLFGDPNNNPDPIRTRAYWAVLRFWTNHWLCNPRDVLRKAKFAYQRLTRGWDDRAVWSVDYWLDSMMPDILRKLKEDKHGVPCGMFEGLPANEHGWHDKPEFEIAEKRWDAIMDKMIAGFEAHRRADEGLYEEELGPYPLYRPKGMPKGEWKRLEDERFRKSRELEERDRKIFEEGMALFAKHYGSLWD